jgi:alpha-N-arabinofuranosidase
VGTVIGLFASGNGGASDNHADFDWFEYGPL